MKDDGTHEGLVEQLTAIKESKPYLLDDTNSNLGGGGSNPSQGSNNTVDLKTNNVSVSDISKILSAGKINGGLIWEIHLIEYKELQISLWQI